MLSIEQLLELIKEKHEDISMQLYRAGRYADDLLAFINQLEDKIKEELE